jgi:pSer/pThr/pTyr-binding forkhead associated (FHA) protein
MNSTNGTYLNGRRVDGQEPLHRDDRIRIGDTEFRYEP